MKKAILFLSIIFTIILINSCKKGPHDPSISFRSRKSRLSGDWVLTSATKIYGDTTWVYDSSTVTITYDSTITETINGTITYHFDGKGAFTCLDTKEFPINFNGGNNVAFTRIENNTGIWNFTGGNNGFKSGEQLLLTTTNLQITSSTQGSNVVLETFEGQPYGFVYNIDKLKNSDLTLKVDLIEKVAGASIIRSEEWFFVKK